MIPAACADFKWKPFSMGGTHHTRDTLVSMLPPKSKMSLVTQQHCMKDWRQFFHFSDTPVMAQQEVLTDVTTTQYKITERIILVTIF